MLRVNYISKRIEHYSNGMRLQNNGTMTNNLKILFSQQFLLFILKNNQTRKN